MNRETPAAEIDPRAFSAAERKALDLIGRKRLYANTSRYYGTGAHRVGRRLAETLIDYGLVRLDHSGGASFLALTGKGRSVLAVIEQRRNRRAA